MSRVVRADGYVWCHYHGCIHEDTTDPYNYGENDPDTCSRDVHRPVYWRPRKDDEEYK